MKHSKKAFSLIELIVAITIGVGIIGGIMFFMGIVSKDYSTIFTKSNTFQKLDNFRDELREIRNRYPHEIISISNIFYEDKTGFSIVIFTKNDLSGAVLLGAYDHNTDDYILDKIENYKKITPFLQKLSKEEVGLIKASPNVDTLKTIMDKTKFDIKKDINILKLGYIKINNYELGKVDFVFTPKYYIELGGMNLEKLYKYEDFNRYYLSILN